MGILVVKGGISWPFCCLNLSVFVVLFLCFSLNSKMSNNCIIIMLKSHTYNNDGAYIVKQITQ